MQLSDDFRSIVLNDTPLLDVRAEVEFEKGAFSTSTNLPILNDKERELVGTMYKKQGNEAAVKLAEELIKQEGKLLRVDAWKKYLKQNPKAYLYCFRGGQRSGISQAWLKESGIDITRLKGGYKAFRTFLMDESLSISKELDTLIVGGRTGSGKTILLNELENAIDLEGLANHRGSSFGSFASIQPTQINFENNLAYELIKFKDKHKGKPLVLEHESQNIGRTFMPKDVYNNFMSGKLILLETPIDDRVDIIYKDYIEQSLDSFNVKYEDEGISVWSQLIENSLDKIQKRLGGKLYQELKIILADALKEHQDNSNTQGYKILIKRLLIEYYDPMYDYQIEKTKMDIIFKGNHLEVSDFIKQISYS